MSAGMPGGVAHVCGSSCAKIAEHTGQSFTARLA